MAFLRALFWIAVTLAVVLFSIHNWTLVTIQLSAGLEADGKLPVLLALAFLVGFLPLYLFHRVACWRGQRRIASLERALAATPPMVEGAPLPRVADVDPLADAPAMPPPGGG